jgi:hypothetical protein
MNYAYALSGLVLLATVPLGLLLVFTQKGQQLSERERWCKWRFAGAVLAGWAAIWVFDTQRPETDEHRAHKWAEQVAEMWESGDVIGATEKIAQAAALRPWEQDSLQD